MAKTFGLWFREPSAGDLLELCRTMREMDAREIFAINQVSADELAMAIYARLPRAVFAAAIGLDNSPAAIAFLGVWPQDESGGLVSANLFGTDRFPFIAGRVVRFVRTHLKQEMQRLKVRRAECRVLKEHASARAFIRACGGVEEAPLPDFGPNGETYVLCAWRRSDWS